MINTALLKEQIKHFWAVSVLSFLAYAFILLVPIHLALRNEHRGQANFLLSNLFRLSGNHPAVYILVITPLIAVFCVMNMLYQKNASTFFYSLPLNRRQLLCTNALAGTILCVVPLVIFSLILMIPIEFHETTRTWVDGIQVNTAAQLFPPALFPGEITTGSIITTPGAVGIFFLRALTVKLFYFGLFWLAFSLSGNGFMALLMSAAIPFLFFLIPGAVDGIALSYVFGFAANDVAIERFWALTSPAGWGLWWPHDTSQLLIRFANYVILGAVIFVGSYYVSKLRKPERTGSSFVFTPVKNVMIFLLSLVAMIIMGAVFWEIAGGLMYYLGFIVGFTLGYIVAQMISEKSFNLLSKLKKLPRYGAFAACIYVSMLLVTQFGLGFYVNHIPDRNEIVGVRVGAFINLSRYNPELGVISFVTDPDIIDQTVTVHRNILARRENLNNLPWQTPNAVPSDEHVQRAVNPFVINYLLADGSVMVRSYPLHNDYLEELGLVALLNSEPMILIWDILLTRPEMILRIDINQTMWDLEIDGSRTTRQHIIDQQNLTITDKESIQSLADFMVNVIVARGHDPRIGWDNIRFSAIDSIANTMIETSINAVVDRNLPGANRFSNTWTTLGHEETEMLNELLYELGLIES